MLKKWKKNKNLRLIRNAFIKKKKKDINLYACVMGPHSRTVFRQGSDISKFIPEEYGKVVKTGKNKVRKYGRQYFKSILFYVATESKARVKIFGRPDFSLKQEFALYY